MSKQDNINSTFDALYTEYEDIRKNSADQDEKGLRMELFYIKYLKKTFDCLNKNADIKVISVERFSRNDGTQGHMYVPVYVNKDDIKKMSSHGYPFKATALIKLLFGFTTYVEAERLEK